jgi:uncharacterized protein YggT (Ycf19 family)
MRCALMPLLEFSMRALLIGIDSILEIYCWILVAVSTLHLLGGFSLVDTNKRYLAVINTYLEKATAPPLWLVRKLLPDLGAVDISHGSAIDADGRALRDRAQRVAEILLRVDATGEMIGVAQPPKATACMILVGSKVPKPPSTRIVNRMIMAWRWRITFCRRA